MANDTTQNDDDTAGLRHFQAGQRARDCESEDGSQVLILGANGKTAGECYVAAINQTVAEANPEYPATSAVADVAFVGNIEDAMGIGWEADEVLELYSYGELDRARIQRYAYPENRLAPVEGGDGTEEIVTDDGFVIEREDCGRCGGTGQITEMVGGRSGLVCCPNCDNIPEYAVPNNPPDDPEARLAEIKERRTELTEKKERAQELRSDIHDARGLLYEAASSDLLPDDTGTKFEHVTDQIEMLLRSFDVARGIRYEQDQLGREKAEIQTLLQYIDETEAKAPP